MNVQNSFSTRKNIENARRSFESVMGKKVKTATVADVEQWLGILREKGRAVSTCRTYLSFVKQLAGLEAELPKRTRTAGRTLSDIELKHLLVVVKPDYYALVASLLLCGTRVLTWVWGALELEADLEKDISFSTKMVLINEASRRGKDVSALLGYKPDGHWINGVDMDEIIFPQPQHGINCRLKSAARKAGIGDGNINLTAIKNTHKRLMAEYKNADEIVKVLGIRILPIFRPILALSVSFQAERKSERDGRFHGIGRRSSLIKSA